MDNPQLGPASLPGQPAVVTRLRACCRDSLLRLAAVGLVTVAGKDARLIQIRQAS